MMTRSTESCRQLHVVHVLVALRPGRPPLPGGEQRPAAPRRDEVERADGDAPVALRAGPDTVGHRIDSRIVEDRLRVNAGELRGAQMRGGGHDVGGDDGAFDHPPVDRAIVAAGVAVAREDRVVGGGQQRARAAGQVGDDALRVGVEVAPVGVHAGDGEFREQGGAVGQGVEGREELPIHDQVLEHSPR